VRDADPACTELMDKLVPTLNESTVKTVAFAAFWTNHFHIDYYNRGDAEKTFLQFSNSASEQALHNFADLISRLVQSGKTVFIILETPTGQAYEPSKILPTGWKRLLGSLRIPDNPKRADMENFNGEMSAKLQQVAEAAGARVIKPMDYLCDKDVCPAFTREGRFIYWNSNHLRASFVRESATYIDQILLAPPKGGRPTSGLR
jgi:hypothetical protein